MSDLGALLAIVALAALAMTLGILDDSLRRRDEREQSEEQDPESLMRGVSGR
jgi:hypothetical protein